jgi:flagellar protein FlaG
MSLEVKALTPAGAPAARPAAAVERPRVVAAGAERQQAQRPEISLERLQAALEAMAARLQPARTNLSFRVDDALNRVVVSIVDADSGAVLRQIPAEEVVRVAQNLQRYLDQSLGVDELA